MPITPKFQVAICGGGIGGLAFALALAAYKDIAIDIYEAAARFEEIGARLNLWGRGITALKKLGLEEKVRAIATIAQGTDEGVEYELRRSDQPSGELFGDARTSAGLGLHRSQLVDLLVKLVSETERVNTHFGKRCISFTQSTVESSGVSTGHPVTLHFADGTSAACDVLVGCDGIKSAVRGELLHNAATTVAANGYIPQAANDAKRFSGTTFSGTVAYRALVKVEDLGAVVGDLRAMTTMKMCIDTASKWAMYDVEPLPFWSKGHVTLLGDAAHATTPFLGSGASQVLKDVYVLSRLLGSSIATRDTLPSVLIAYERVRSPRANSVILGSRKAGCAFEFLGEYDGASNEAVAKAVNELLGGQ